VVFCIGEAIALPIVHEARKAGLKLRVVSFGHNIYRPRIDLADRIWGCRRGVERFLVFDENVARKSNSNLLYREQTDDAFFSPATEDMRATAVSERPLLVSIGLEMRDNVTLAEAVEGLAVDVVITAFSRDARENPRARPNPMPDNMVGKFYPWPELADIYRRASIVVVPICSNSYAAGITSVLEGAASARPVIATANEALMTAVADQEIATWVPPGNPVALRSALEALINDPSRMEKLGHRARVLQQKHHSFDNRLKTVKALLQEI